MRVKLKNNFEEQRVCMRRLVIISSTLFIVGCTSLAKDYAWMPTFGTEANFNKAIAECEYDVEILGKDKERTAAAIFGMQSPLFERCMNKHGYVWQKKETQIK